MNPRIIDLISNNKLSKFCKDNHIKKMSLFGSVLTENFNSESDIDILVEFEEGLTPGIFKILEMEEEISSLFEGRKVDLRTPNDISRYFRNQVIENSEVLYARS
ncbi:MAG TPA: nucleotidyltransferase [Candidatus Methanofastidiosum sp.]|nr:nucleotidyltransferase [Methanofastidiosum sp.]